MSSHSNRFHLYAVEFTGTPTVDKAGKVIEKKAGTELINDLINDSKFDIVISDASKDGQDHTRPVDPDAGEDGRGTGSTVEYNPDNTNSSGSVPVVNADGSTGAPAFIFLGHELFHAQEYKNGKRDKTIDKTKKDPDNKDEKGILDNSEIKARKKENEIRAENHIIARASND